jgi:hypothetical protein
MTWVFLAASKTSEVRASSSVMPDEDQRINPLSLRSSRGDPELLRPVGFDVLFVCSRPVDARLPGQPHCQIDLPGSGRTCHVPPKVTGLAGGRWRWWWR